MSRSSLKDVFDCIISKQLLNKGKMTIIHFQGAKHASENVILHFGA